MQRTANHSVTQGTGGTWTLEERKGECEEQRQSNCQNRRTSVRFPAVLSAIASTAAAVGAPRHNIRNEKLNKTKLSISNALRCQTAYKSEMTTDDGSIAELDHFTALAVIHVWEGKIIQP